MGTKMPSTCLLRSMLMRADERGAKAVAVRLRRQTKRVRDLKVVAEAFLHHYFGSLENHRKHICAQYISG